MDEEVCAMAIQPDYIIYNPVTPDVKSPPRAEELKQEKVLPLTPGVWQNEATTILKMYDKKEGSFSPLTPQGQVDSPKDDPFSLVPFRTEFKFLTEDTVRNLQQSAGTYVGDAKAAAIGVPSLETTRPEDIISLTGGALYDPNKTELKSDNFPDRIIYWDGGLYPAKKKDAAEAEQHANAPNYRKMDGKPVHGLGQPTKQGFHDVLNHIGGKKKPVVWADMRAEGVIYINGKPYNLRQMKGFENVDFKKGASGKELEALEEQLKQQLIARGEVEVVEEKLMVGPDGKPVLDNKGKQKTERVTHVEKLTPENCQTTQDVVKGLQDEGYKIEYKRIPVTDETSPKESDMDEIRRFVAEAKKNHPKDDVQYVFNCHQGKGRTTTAMVAAGITLDGKATKLDLPLIGPISFDDGKKRAERNINENFHLQNIREAVDEYKQKAADAGKDAAALKKKAHDEQDPAKKAELEKEAKAAEARQLKYENNTREFTKRYATMLKYSEYICEFGENSEKPAFEEWVKGAAQQKDLEQKWTALNDYFKIPGAAGQPGTALA
jgi:hypothetical protein